MMMTRPWRLKLTELRLSRSNVRYAAKTALSILVVWFSLGLMGVENPVFALISVVVVAEPQLGTSLFLAWSRMLATVIGVAAALVVVVVLGVNPWALAIAIFAVVLLCTEIFEVPGAWKLGPATSALIIGMAAVGGQENPGLAEAWHIALTRFWETIYGIVVTVAISRFVWPEWSRERLQHAAAEYCRASTRRIAHFLRALAGEPNAAHDADRAAIVAALRKLDATVIDAHHERWYQDASEQVTTTILTASRALYDSCLVVERFVAHSAHEGADNGIVAATVELLHAMHDRLGGMATWLDRSGGSLPDEPLKAARRSLAARLRAIEDSPGEQGMPAYGLMTAIALAEAVERAARDLETLVLALAEALPAKI